MNAFLISGVAMTPISGQLSDVYGKKRVLLIMVIIYGVGVLIGGFSNSWLIFLLARVLQGIGISIIPVALGIITNLFPRDKIAIGQGLIMTMAGCGGVIGFTVGGYIIEEYGWQLTFFLLNPVTIELIILIWRSSGTIGKVSMVLTVSSKGNQDHTSLKRKEYLSGRPCDSTSDTNNFPPKLSPPSLSSILLIKDSSWSSGGLQQFS